MRGMLHNEWNMTLTINSLLILLVMDAMGSGILSLYLTFCN